MSKYFNKLKHFSDMKQFRIKCYRILMNKVCSIVVSLKPIYYNIFSNLTHKMPDIICIPILSYYYKLDKSIVQTSARKNF